MRIVSYIVATLTNIIRIVHYFILEEYYTQFDLSETICYSFVYRVM